MSDADYLAKVRAQLFEAAGMLKLLSMNAPNKAGVDEVMTNIGLMIQETEQLMHAAKVVVPESDEGDYPTWEHKVFVLRSDDLKGAEDKMNELGAEGWELAQALYIESRVEYSKTVYFMRR